MARCLGLHDSSIKRKLASLQERIKRISFPKNVINDKKRELGTALIYGFRKLILNTSDKAELPTLPKWQ